MKLILLIFLMSILIVVFIIYFKYFRRLRPKENGFEFVYVENNGNFRELKNEEIEYLKEEFYSNDGGRPYIKTSYKDLTPEGKYQDLSIELEFRKI